MAEQDTYTFEILSRFLMFARPIAPIDEYHRALALTAMEAVIDGAEGYAVQCLQKGFVRVTVPVQVAEDGRWMWRRSVL
jgi:hypothetical protein